MFRLGILLWALLAYFSVAFAQQVGSLTPPVKNRGEKIQKLQNSDTLETHVTERNRRLYDSIQSKSTRRTVPRLLYKTFFRLPKRDTTASGRVLDETKALKRYEGKIIGDIRIVRNQIFQNDSNWLERVGNKLHTLTRERIIRRDLLFHSGEEVDPELIVRTQQLLRSRPYISDTDIIITPDSLDSTMVNIVLQTRDSWTISIDAALRSRSRTMAGLSDGNIFGLGHRLGIMTYFDRSNFSYGGNHISYEIPNLMGSFYSASIEVGRNFEERTMQVNIGKEFLKPTDYELGVTYGNNRSEYYMREEDTIRIARVRTFNAWAGVSRYIRSINSSIFVTGHYHNAYFIERPTIAPDLNPAMHNGHQLLGGIGLYREKFLSVNMVYGYGLREYLPTGYKAEVVSGYSWGEFDDALYLGLSYRTGNYYSIGYLMGGFTLGSYISHYNGMWSHSAIDIDLQWFSNLFILRRNRIRQFLSLNYTQGWNRERGNNESIIFTHPNGPQALNEHVTGTNRMVLNSETVFFTPFQPWGFRFAFFGFADFGLLGYSPNIFKNNFFATLGGGLRIKNERLIFSTIQIRVGIAFGKGGLVGCDYFQLSSSTRLEQFRYRPTRPEVVNFR
ncbi:MAG: hypothetical protein E7148_01495 [Rikenellaceae bacterium]|nr:hypothetical protein [Rikenellaceae bacterium]